MKADELKTKQTTDYVVINTKVSRPAALLLERLCAAKGLSVYELNQMVLDTLIRYMSEECNLTVEIEKAMAIFEHMVGWKQALNVADPAVSKKIVEATYYLTDAADKKHGVRAVHVIRPFFGNWQQTYNIQDILKRTLRHLCPERYARLERLAADLECGDILEVIDQLIDMHSHDADIKAVREEFEDINRAENGKAIEYAARTKRKMHYSLNDQPTIFDNE